jgi:hypothetical protein
VFCPCQNARIKGEVAVLSARLIKQKTLRELSNLTATGFLLTGVKNKDKIHEKLFLAALTRFEP